MNFIIKQLFKIYNVPRTIIRNSQQKKDKNKIQRALKEFNGKMKPDHPFFHFPQKIAGDCSSDPHEFFDYYDGYAFWLSKKLNEMGNGKEILDVGNTKRSNAINSVTNNVTSCVLMDCQDRLTNIKYVIHDVADALPFKDDSYDVFSSAVAMQLVGLGRYGDKMDPYCLQNFVKELNRVMKPSSDLIISNTYGNNCLDFNNHYVFNLETLKEIFSEWNLVDYLIDNGSRVKPHSYVERYTKDLKIDDDFPGDYRVIFLHFKR